MRDIYAIIDTEGSGLFIFKDKATGLAVPADAPGQPRLAQLAGIITDTDMNEVTSFNYFVRPDGWTMDPGATAVNGLTDEWLAANGVPISTVLDYYERLIEANHVIIAYHAQHDTKQIRAELRRAGRDDLFEKTRNVCAMRGAKSLGVRNPNRGGSWPSLEHACLHFNIPPEPRPHNAIHGARKCFEVVRAMRETGDLPEPAVHYSNARGEAA